MKRPVWILAAGVLVGYVIGSYAGSRAERVACNSGKAEVAILAYELERRANTVAETLDNAESVAVIWHNRAAYFQQLYIEEWIAARRANRTADLVH